LMYGCHRPANAGNTYWRLAHYIVPFFVIPPAGPLDLLIAAKAYVPLDDEHNLNISIYRKLPRSGPRPTRTGRPIPGVGAGPNRGIVYQENTTDWLGRWRLVNQPENDYLIDRDAQRTGGIFSGIDGIQAQDTSICETMGPITDRTLEHLASSDETLARARRKLVRLAQAYEKDRSAYLPGVDDPGIYRGHRGGYFLAPSDRPFREAYGEMIRTHANDAPKWAAE
jgi:phthalate 4,5-dioxygenase